MPLAENSPDFVLNNKKDENLIEKELGKGALFNLIRLNINNKTNISL